MPQYRITAGKHYVRNKDGDRVALVKGEVLTLSTEEAAKWPGKFELVATVDVDGEEKIAPAVPAKDAPKQAPGQQAQKPAGK